MATETQTPVGRSMPRFGTMRATRQRMTDGPQHQEVQLPMRPHLTVPQRFWSKVNFDGPIPDYASHLGRCWLWIGTIEYFGYGRFWLKRDEHGRQYRIYAYRYAYEFCVGPIPDGLELDHLCRVPLCVNPSHVEPVTHRENLLRGTNQIAQQAQQTHCLRGHPFDEANTYREPSTNRRHCRICKHMLWQRWSAQNRRAS